MRRPHYLYAALSTALLLVYIAQSPATAPQVGGASGTTAAATIAGCAVFPADNIWNTPIDTLPVDQSSAAYISTIGASGGLHADFGAGGFESSPIIGIPFTTVTNAQPAANVTFEYKEESDPGPYLIPSDAPIEGGGGTSGDRHILVVNRDTCVLYELYATQQVNATTWTADSGAVFNLKSHALRPDTWTSADAAGLPILPGLVRYDEVAAGAIQHMLRFTAVQTRKAHVWPARHDASSSTDPKRPPLGQRFRLKAGFDTSGFSPDARVILQALKTYGMILADNGSNWFISGAPDERWDNDVLTELGRVKGNQFEAVDMSALMLQADSGQVKATTAPGNQRLALPIIRR